MLSEFSRVEGSKGRCHGNQIWAKISQNCTYLSSVQDIDTLFKYTISIFKGAKGVATATKFGQK